MKKIAIIMLSLIMLVASLPACSKEPEEELPEGAVRVYSCYPDLDYIVPGDFKLSLFEDGTYTRYNFATFVSEVGGSLAIMPSHTCGSSSAPYVSTSTVYNIENVFGGEDGVYSGEDLILSEKCVGMIHSYDTDKLLVFTATDNTGKVYAMSKDIDNDGYTLTDDKISIGGKIFLIYYEWQNMFTDAPKKIYVVSSEGIVILHADTYLNTAKGEFESIEVEKLAVPEWFKYVRPNNATQTKDGTVWIGEREGVVAINTDGSMEYYPIDYLEAMREKEKK